ncbi:hypothetical protein NEMIN01_0351 [Nematocida minor]|uniref:uncharacterized protein n=1 Tax=Nematocida minor TaxID=1912983 RepID=UPI00221EBFBC|nr:uncharacterized protein NEMIN01_0351 [Nematocida minor]KAI5189185.1 hypothetical protein NEMIN01_0351 [Nematocida minor]
MLLQCVNKLPLDFTNKNAYLAVYYSRIPYNESGNKEIEIIKNFNFFMILQRVLKQVILGVFLLAYLQRASCGVPYLDIVKIKDYWCDKALYFHREGTIRSDFITKCEALKTEALSFGLNLDEAIEKGNEDIFNIRCQTTSLRKIIEEMVQLISQIEYSCIYRKDASFIANIKVELEKIFLKALNRNTSIVKAINEYDSHMLEVLERYYEKKYKSINLKEMTLFKLAKRNKILATKMVYYLFEMQRFNTDFSIEAETEKHVENMASNKLMRCKLDFLSAIKKAVKETDGDPLETANAHLALLLCDENNDIETSMDNDAMSVYLSLAKENISEEEISKCKNVTPAQVVKIMMLEHLMADNVYDYKTNHLLRALGRVIDNAFNPMNYSSTDVHEGMKVGRKAQDKILKCLNYVWNSQHPSSDDMFSPIYCFCKNNSISYSAFKDLQRDYLSLKWIYQLDAPTPAAEGLLFDLSYTHPIYYVCKRYSYAAYISEMESKSGGELYMAYHDVFTHSSYKKSAKSGDQASLENVNNCIKAWLFPTTDVFTGEDNAKECNTLAADFNKYIKITEREEQLNQIEGQMRMRMGAIKGPAKAEASTSNPLQDNQMETEEA